MLCNSCMSSFSRLQPCHMIQTLKTLNTMAKFIYVLFSFTFRGALKCLSSLKLIQWSRSRCILQLGCCMKAYNCKVVLQVKSKGHFHKYLISDLCFDSFQSPLTRGALRLVATVKCARWLFHTLIKSWRRMLQRLRLKRL